MDDFDNLKFKFLILFWLLFPSGSDGQIPSLGRCNNGNLKAMNHFEKLRFMGKWYETERFYMMRDVIAKCIEVSYERFLDGRIYVNNVYTNRLTNRRETIGGKFRLTAENIGEFNTRYENVPDWILPKQLSFINYNATVRVLHTDYDSFAILFSCRNLNQYSHLENSWLLTREQQPSEEVLQSAYGFLDKFGLRNYFVKSDQSKCEP